MVNTKPICECSYAGKVIIGIIIGFVIIALVVIFVLNAFGFIPWWGPFIYFGSKTGAINSIFGAGKTGTFSGYLSTGPSGPFEIKKEVDKITVSYGTGTKVVSSVYDSSKTSITSTLKGDSSDTVLVDVIQTEPPNFKLKYTPGKFLDNFMTLDFNSTCGNDGTGTNQGTGDVGPIGLLNIGTNVTEAVNKRQYYLGKDGEFGSNPY